MPETIQSLLVQVKAAVGAVGKGERNAQQGFNFRGIDAVINAVAPALIENEIVVVPNVKKYWYGSVEVGKSRTPMGHARVVVEYIFIGPKGDQISCSAPGEAMDSGDKATAKAMSVAYRTALLQALSLPTTEMDPDAIVYERSNAADLNRAVTRVQQAWVAAHGALDLDALAADFAQRYEGADVRAAGPEQLDAYAEALGAAPRTTPQEMLARATQTRPAEEVPSGA